MQIIITSIVRTEAANNKTTYTATLIDGVRRLLRVCKSTNGSVGGQMALSKADESEPA